MQPFWHILDNHSSIDVHRQPSPNAIKTMELLLSRSSRQNPTNINTITLDNKLNFDQHITDIQKKKTTKTVKPSLHPTSCCNSLSEYHSTIHLHCFTCFFYMHSVINRGKLKRTAAKILSLFTANHTELNNKSTLLPSKHHSKNITHSLNQCTIPQGAEPSRSGGLGWSKDLPLQT